MPHPDHRDPEAALRPDETTRTFRHIGDLLAHHARINGDAPAILGIDEPPVTYAALEAQRLATRAALRQFGIGPADRVALVMPDGPDAAVAFLTIAAAATTAPLNPAYRAAELSFYFEDLAIKAVVVPSGSYGDAAVVARERGLTLIELSRSEASGLFEFKADRTRPAVDGDSGPDAIAMVLHTSGTTARPKIVPLTHRNLCTSARNTADALALTTEDRCLNVMPLFHVHGLIGALLSTITAGGSIVCTPGFNAPKFLQWLADARPTWYTAVPTMHQAVAERAAASGTCPIETSLRVIRSCSAALPPSVLAELERVTGVPVIEAYGMTEAAHQIASNPLPPRAHKPGSTGLPAGPDLAVLSEDGALLEAHQIGEICIKGPNVTAGYTDPKANESAFLQGWFRTGDQGYRDDDGYIFLTGRIKELINRGGEKLAPREIDEALLAHPAVAQAVTFGIPDARLGEAVAAAAVLRPGVTVTERQLREFVAARLTFFKVPARIVFVDELPKGPTGKLQRRGLGERLGLTDTAAPEPAVAIDPLDAPVSRVAEIAAEVLGVVTVDPMQSFVTAGGDSLLATQFVARLQDAFAIDIPLLDVFDAPSLNTLACLIAERILADIESLESTEAII